MTEKRFRIGYVCGDYGLIDNDEWIDLHSMSENSEKNVQICINKMNELADENEQLKDKYNEQSVAYEGLEEQVENLLDFKDKVFELLHKKLEEYPYLTLSEKWDNDCKYKHSCRENHERNVAYASTHTLLNELIKELQRND